MLSLSLPPDALYGSMCMIGLFTTGSELKAVELTNQQGPPNVIRLLMIRVVKVCQTRLPTGFKGV
jgi:hypothetical protein